MEQPFLAKDPQLQDYWRAKGMGKVKYFLIVQTRSYLWQIKTMPGGSMQVYTVCTFLNNFFGKQMSKTGSKGSAFIPWK